MTSKIIERNMRCPYCGNVFGLTFPQLAYNTRFKCPACKQFNNGSYQSDNDGNLMGVKMDDPMGKVN